MTTKKNAINMNDVNNITLGVLGSAASWSLGEFHLITATSAAILTSIYMCIVIYRSLTKK